MGAWTNLRKRRSRRPLWRCCPKNLAGNTFTVYVTASVSVSRVIVSLPGSDTSNVSIGKRRFHSTFSGGTHSGSVRCGSKGLLA
jgi:hypothetical protein